MTDAKETVVIEVEVDASEVKDANKDIENLGKTSNKTKESLDQMNEGAKKFGDSIKNLDFKGAVQGFTAMTKGALAFIATPIGAVIAAVGAAIGALTAYFKGSQEGQDKFNKLANIGAAIVGKFGDAVQAVGKFIFDNLIKGFEALGSALSFLIPGFDEFVQKVSDFLNLDNANTLSALEEQQRLLELQLTTKRAILKAEIEDAKLRAESTKDIKVRAQAYAEVESKVRELFAAERELAQVELDAALERAQLSNNTYEDNLKIEELKARLFELDRERDAALKENAVKQLTNNEALNKSYQEQIKLKEHILGVQKSDLDLTAQTVSSNLAHIDSIDKITKAQTKQIITGWNKIQEARKKDQDERKKDLELEKQMQLQRVAILSNSVGAIGQLFDQQTQASKIASATQAAINSFLAGTEVLKDPSFIGRPVQRGIAMLAVIAAGLAQQKKILSAGKGTSASAAIGGDIGPGTTGGQPQSSAGLQANANAGGVAAATANTAPIDNQIAVNTALRDRAPVVLDYSEFTRFQTKVSKKVALTEA